MTDEVAIQLVLDHLIVGHRLGDRLNAWRKAWGVNPMQMMIVLLIWMGTRPHRKQDLDWPRTTVADLAAQLHCGRKTISAQLQTLEDRGLVRPLPAGELDDGRITRYELQPVAAELATKVVWLMGEHGKLIGGAMRSEERKPYANALGRVIEELVDAPALLKKGTVDMRLNRNAWERKVQTLETKARSRDD